jgi:hypothetical protein
MLKIRQNTTASHNGFEFGTAHWESGLKYSPLHFESPNAPFYLNAFTSMPFVESIENRANDTNIFPQVDSSHDEHISPNVPSCGGKSNSI